MNVFWLLVIIIPYFALTACLGIKGYRDTKTASDFLVGGRSVHPYIMALSYGATFISTSAIVGFGGVAANLGLSLLWLPLLNILVGVIIAFIFFGKRTRMMGLKMNAHTFPEFMGRRTGSRFIQMFAGAMIFLFMPLYTAAVLIGASRIIEGLLSIPYLYSLAIFAVVVAVYVIMGGLKGVMYTDALQGTLMFIGMIVLLFVIYAETGGVPAAHRALTDLAPFVPEKLAAIGHRGWTASPAFNSPLWWTIYSSLVLGVGIGVLAQPQLVVRFMTVKSNKELNRAVGIGSVFILVTAGTAYIVGALSNVYFMDLSGKLPIQLAGGNPDKIIPLFISSALPGWFSYLFMLVILSAAMSTLSSQFHAIGTSIGRDIYEQAVTKKEKKTNELLVNKVSMVISILITVWISVKMENTGIIARATAIFFGIMASAFLAPYIASLYWKRLTRPGMTAGILTGFAASVFTFLFINEKVAAVFGICKLLTGRITLAEGIITAVDPLVFALPLSVIATIAVSLITKVENKEQIEKLFS